MRSDHKSPPKTSRPYGEDIPSPQVRRDIGTDDHSTRRAMIEHRRRKRSLRAIAIHPWSVDPRLVGE
jgi:hypothetical protein